MVIASLKMLPKDNRLPQNKCYFHHYDEGQKFSQQSKLELVEAVRDRYLQTGRKEKSKILDEFVAVTGFHHKHMIRALWQGNLRRQERWGRG